MTTRGASAVLNGAFEDLSVGSLVRYVLSEGEGEAGPQASTVELVGELLVQCERAKNATYAGNPAEESCGRLRR